MEPDLDTLRDLLETARLTPEALAVQTGLDVGTVRRTLNGQTAPQQTTRGLIADALEVPLWQLTRVVWPQTDASEEERKVHRRRLLQIAAGGSAAAAASLLPGTDALEVSDSVSRLVARFSTTDPSAMFNEAKAVLTTLRGVWYSPSLHPGQRRAVLADAVDAASLAAWSATLSNQLVDAEAYFDLAQKYADRSELGYLRGAALASSARLDRPIAGNDPLAALDKLGVAIPLLGSSPMVQWATFMEAEAYAASNRPRECFEALERIDRMVVTDEGRGFFSLVGLLPDTTANGAKDQWAGECYAYLGQADRAVSHLNRALVGASSYRLIGAIPATKVEVARAYAIAGEPEAACAYAVEALTGAQEIGYRAGVVRVRQVRARLEEWAPSACVQELDEQLMLALP